MVTWIQYIVTLTYGLMVTWSDGHLTLGHVDTGHVDTSSCGYMQNFCSMYSYFSYQGTHPIPVQASQAHWMRARIQCYWAYRYILSYTGSRGKQEIHVYAEIEFYKYGYKDSLIHGYNIVRRTIGTIFCWEYCAVHSSRGTNCREMATVAPDNLWFLNHLWSSL